jgi:hypothetical protein
MQALLLRHDTFYCKPYVEKVRIESVQGNLPMWPLVEKVFRQLFPLGFTRLAMLCFSLCLHSLTLFWEVNRDYTKDGPYVRQFVELELAE